MTGRLPSAARFQAAIDSAFEMSPLEGDARPIELRLAQVRTTPAPAGYEQFAAVFVGPLAPLHEQGTYRFTHPVLGTMELFTVPLGPGRTGMQYEVCISHEDDGDRSAR